jgi:hypothetical protein
LTEWKEAQELFLFLGLFLQFQSARVPGKLVQVLAPALFLFLSQVLDPQALLALHLLVLSLPYVSPRKS